MKRFTLAVLCLMLLSAAFAEAPELFDLLSEMLESRLGLVPEETSCSDIIYTAKYSCFTDNDFFTIESFFIDNGFETVSYSGRNSQIHLKLAWQTYGVDLSYERSAQIAVLTCARELSCSVVHLPVTRGDIVCFGSYEQDNDLTNGPEMIEWLVLQADRDSALLLSRYALDSQVYVQARENDEPSAYVSYWEDSYMRQWLNSDFLCAAFQEDELSRLMLCSVSDDPNPYYDTPPGNDTLDYIWLPSVVEMERYFPDKTARIASATAYAFAQGHITYQAMPVCGLRSTGNSASSHACVNVRGSVFNVSRNDLYSAIRPMIRVKFD